MGYNIRYGRHAEKYLDAQTRETQKRIMDAVSNLPSGDVRKLSGREGYRLVIGGYRVLFNYIDKTSIKVVAIGPRGDIYKK